jgi:hypothetical protein
MHHRSHLSDTANLAHVRKQRTTSELISHIVHAFGDIVVYAANESDALQRLEQFQIRRAAVLVSASSADAVPA